jgi:hypothetical protein
MPLQQSAFCEQALPRGEQTQVPPEPQVPLQQSVFWVQLAASMRQHFWSPKVHCSVESQQSLWLVQWTPVGAQQVEFT